MAESATTASEGEDDRPLKRHNSLELLPPRMSELRVALQEEMEELKKRRAESEKMLAYIQKTQAESEKMLAYIQKTQAEGEDLKKRQAESEKRQAESEKRQAESEKRQAESEKRQAESEKMLAYIQETRAESENLKKRQAESEKRQAESEKRPAESSNCIIAQLLTSQYRRPLQHRSGSVTDRDKAGGQSQLASRPFYSHNKPGPGSLHHLPPPMHLHLSRLVSRRTPKPTSLPGFQGHPAPTPTVTDSCRRLPTAPPEPPSVHAAEETHALPLRHHCCWCESKLE